MNNYKNLKVWQKSIELAKEAYILTESYPKEEKYGLTSQLRRAAVSIASNIAEGAGRGSNRDFKRFLDISYGSLCELETQIHIAVMLQFNSEEDCKAINGEIDNLQKMIYALIKSLNVD